jgi:hypothetical protein
LLVAASPLQGGSLFAYLAELFDANARGDPLPALA